LLPICFFGQKVRLTTHHLRQRQVDLDKPWTDMETVLWGGISGALAGFSTTPLDVIKTRIMTGAKKEERTMGKALARVLKEEGIPFFSFLFSFLRPPLSSFVGINELILLPSPFFFLLCR
jgi:hypothetical protein